MSQGFFLFRRWLMARVWAVRNLTTTSADVTASLGQPCGFSASQFPPLKWWSWERSGCLVTWTKLRDLRLCCCCCYVLVSVRVFQRSSNERLCLCTRVCTHQFSSVAQSCLTLCDPMDCSTSGLPVHHQLPEFTRTHVHRVGDAIQPSHPLSSPSSPAFSLSQHQGLFQWVSSLHQVAKVLEFQLQHQSFQWIFRTDLL